MFITIAVFHGWSWKFCCFMEEKMNTSKDGLNNRFELLLSGATRVKKRDTKEKKEQKDRNATMYYLGYVGELGFAISIPIVLCTLLGKYLDTIWNLYPKMTLSLLGIGSFVSIINFIEIIKTIVKK